MTEIPVQAAELRVQPERVINILKARLLDEIAKTALLEAALQEAQERERVLAGALVEQQALAQQRPGVVEAPDPEEKLCS